LAPHPTHLETHSTTDCSSLAKSSLPCFCDIRRLLSRFWLFGPSCPRGWRPRNSARSKSTIMGLPVCTSYRMFRNSASRWRTHSRCNSAKALATTSTIASLTW
jgi:hypothetical protein